MMYSRLRGRHCGWLAGGHRVLIGYSSAWLIAKSIDLLLVIRTASASSVARG